MDYIFFSSIMFFQLLALVISYDIACQWTRHLLKRLMELPPHLRVDFNATKLTALIPKFHLPAHTVSCHTKYSYHLATGVGATDGEGIERDWAMLNPLANSTKEMGPGSRHDTLDDHLADLNWRKITGLGMFS